MKFNTYHNDLWAHSMVLSLVKCRKSICRDSLPQSICYVTVKSIYRSLSPLNLCTDQANLVASTAKVLNRAEKHLKQQCCSSLLSLLFLGCSIPILALDLFSGFLRRTDALILVNV